MSAARECCRVLRLSARATRRDSYTVNVRCHCQRRFIRIVVLCGAAMRAKSQTQSTQWTAKQPNAWTARDTRMTGENSEHSRRANLRRPEQAAQRWLWRRTVICRGEPITAAVILRGLRRKYEAVGRVALDDQGGRQLGSEKDTTATTALDAAPPVPTGAHHAAPDMT